MSNTRHRGQRLGYLEYHAQVLSERVGELDAELQGIREKHSGKEKKLKERSALLDFREDVKNRSERIDYQIEGVKKHEVDDALDVANKQSESSYAVHQGENQIPNEAGRAFTTASELKGDLE